MEDQVFNPKIALVLQGGGARGAFTAGVLDVLMEHHVTFPFVIGTSAGSLNGVNFLSGDIGRSKYVSTELMNDKKFVSFGNLIRRGSVFNFDYLFHTVPSSILPFNQEAYDSSKVEFYAAATRMADGKAKYFHRGEVSDFYQALAASSSLPLLAKPVLVDGERYLDGGTAACIPFRKPLEEGFEKIVIIETRQDAFRRPNPSKRKVLMAKLLYRRYPKFIEAYKHQGDTYNVDEDEILSLRDKGIAFVVRPDVAPDVSTTEKNKQKLTALYEVGRKIMERELPALLDFMGVNHE